LLFYLLSINYFCWSDTSMMMNSQALVPITVAKGDGIGPEIMDATLAIIQAAGARIAIEEIAIGEKLYAKGILTGIEDASWESLRRTKVFLKAPITTPQGGGVKSLNVTTRKTLGLYANIRPCVSYDPFVRTKHPTMDVVIVRENEEDLYAGIEYRQSDDVYQCLKLITRPGSEKIIRYAFEYAVANNRKKVTCFTKDNIMKMTDGIFHKVFDQVGEEYPEIEKEHWIVDIGAAKLADTPEAFDVVVMPNLYGDILSDVAAQIAGSVGLAGSANIGDHCAMFEAIHGSAPRRAGQNLANPSGLLLGAVQMLVHIDQPDVAANVHNAWLKTLEDGIHTYDIFKEGISKQKVGTKEFAQAVIERLGQNPVSFKPVVYNAKPPAGEKKPTFTPTVPAKKETVGVDVYVHSHTLNADQLAEKLLLASLPNLKLKVISSRGQKVWPNGFAETFTVDHWRCRYLNPEGQPIKHTDIIQLLTAIDAQALDVIKTENLCTFDGEEGWTSVQGG
jgi:isocitrate dehydrogenase